MIWNQWAALIFTGLYTILASAGFWKFFSQRNSEKEAEVKLLLGIARESIYIQAIAYIERGWIYREEYENLITHLYAPYKVLGGNSVADRIMEEVGDLPFRSRVLTEKFNQDLKGIGED